MSSIRRAAWTGLVCLVFAGAVVASWLAFRTGPLAAEGAASADPAGATCAGDGCHVHATRGGGAANAPSHAGPGRPRMLVFSSKSCAACARMAPVVEAAARACGGERDVDHVDFDDEAGETLAATYGVALLPSFVSVDAEGLEVARLTGVHPQERLEHAIEEIRGVRCAAVDAPVRGAAL